MTTKLDRLEAVARERDRLRGAVIGDEAGREQAEARVAELEEENGRLREFVVAHTLLDKGYVDFDVQAETVERFRRAADAVSDVIAKALNPESESA